MSRRWKVGDRFRIEGMVSGGPDNNGHFVVEFRTAYARYFRAEEMALAIPISPKPSITSVSIHNRVLSEAEVQAKYQLSEQPTLRDQFAMAALTGYLASMPEDANMRSELIARAAYLLADAMLKAREAQNETDD